MIHVDKFVDRIKKYESTNNRDFIMSMRDAKDLHADITKLLSSYHDLISTRSTQDPVSETEEVVITGGSFK